MLKVVNGALERRIGIYAGGGQRLDGQQAAAERCIDLAGVIAARTHRKVVSAG